MLPGYRQRSRFTNMTAISKQCKPKNTDAQQTRYEYSPANDIGSNNGRKKHNKKLRKRMQENPESVVYDYKYGYLDKSGVLSLDDTPCDVKFWANRMQIGFEQVLNTTQIYIMMVL